MLALVGPSADAMPNCFEGMAARAAREAGRAGAPAIAGRIIRGGIADIERNGCGPFFLARHVQPNSLSIRTERKMNSVGLAAEKCGGR
jgi:hypothetical protein